MEMYTIYCTPEQTRKALEFGAPIERIPIGGRDASRPSYFTKSPDEEGYQECPAYYIPAAEEMIGWIEEQGIAIDLHTYFSADDSKIHHYQYTVTDLVRVFNGEYSTRKEATIAAIDAALEYLSTK